jgi:NAD(P)-dependent dehydrogenase (short-subunit alcohol dehydrogenase family)
MTADLALADLQAMLDVNVRARLLFAQAAIPHLSSEGRIISIGSSLAERVPFPGVTAYAMSKSALLSLTRGLSRELGPLAITVNLVLRFNRHGDEPGQWRECRLSADIARPIWRTP